MTKNPWCEVLGIEVPSLERAKEQPDANVYSLLITALLERGEALTLEEVARRFQAAGIAPAERALLSLKRCRPARAPVYRDGDRYSLDPHDEELGLWVFRLGMRPPNPPALTLVSEDGEGPSEDRVREIADRARARRSAFNAEKLAALRRVILHPFPANAPEALVLLDVNQRSLTTLIGSELEHLAELLEVQDVIAAVEVRPLLRRLGVNPGSRRLHELGPPQRSTTLNRRGRKLNITLSLLVTSSCLISRPFGDSGKLRGYLREGKTTQLRRRLEADAKSLHALYQYGRLHGGVRLRWGHLDTGFPAPWAQPDEPRLFRLKAEARDDGRLLEAVVGAAPGWSEPWSRARRHRVVDDPRDHWGLIVDDAGQVIDDDDVQAARLVDVPCR